MSVCNADTSIVDSAAFVSLAAAVRVGVAGLGIHIHVAYHMATLTQTSALPTVTVPMDSQSFQLPVRYTCSPDIQPFVVGWFKDILLLNEKLIE